MSCNSLLPLGVDVASQQIEVAGAGPRRVANEVVALRRWLDELHAEHPGLHLVCEATGGYERPLVAVAQALGVAVSVVNARRVRDFARSTGRWEKTDRIDAEVLRLFGERLRPAPTPAVDPAQAQLREWVQTRDYYVALRQAAEQRLGQAQAPAVQALIRREIAQYQRWIATTEQQLDQWLSTAVAWQAKVQTLCLVSGVGVLVSLGLLAHLPELGQLSDGAISKLAGVAPVACDSGQWHGQRHIAGGRAAARRVLYQAALVAARHNPYLQPFYRRLRDRGKPAKLALTAVARKLLCFLNQTLKPAFPHPA